MRGLALAAGAYLCWGLLAPGNEILLRHMGPWWMLASRSIVALLLVAAWLGPRARGVLKLGARGFGSLAMGGVVSFGLFVWAQTYIGPAEATVGFFTAPIWTAILGWWLLRERPSIWTIPVVIVLLVGALMVVGSVGVGLVLAVGSGASWGLYAVLVRSMDYGWRTMLAGSLLVAAPVFLVAAAFEPMPAWNALATEAYVWTAIMVIIPTIAAIALFQSALRYTSAVNVNLLVGIELVGAVFWSWLLLGNRLSGTALIGVGLVLVAVTWHVVASRPTA